MKNEERKSKKGKTAADKAKRTGKYALHFSLFIILFSFVAACELGGPVKLPSYTIVYHPNGGEGEMDNSTLVYGASRNLNANGFTREGYSFIGWAETPAGAVKYADSQSVNNLTKKDGDVINLYAQWRGNSYTVIYNANGGEGSMEDSVFTYDVPQNLRSNAFTRTGYTFAGWAMTADGAVEFTDGESVDLSAAEATATLYAVWQGISYTVAYDANGGQGDMAESNFIYGTAQNLRANTFTLAGHALAGWARTPNGAVEFANGESVTGLIAIAGDTVTLYAQWALACEVSFNADGGSPAPPLQMVAVGGKVTEPPAMTKAGYALEGWYTEAAFTNRWNFASDTVTADITLYAKWGYAVNFNANGGEPEPPAQIVTQGGTVTEPPAMTKTGCTFDGWYTEADFNNRWDFNTGAVDSAATLYARWVCTVTFAANGGEPEPPAQTVTQGGKVTEPPAMTKTGADFTGWYTEAGLTNKWNFASDTVTADTALYAGWIETITVPGATLNAKLNWLFDNAASNTNYVLEATAAENLGPRILSYTGKTDIVIILRGNGAERIITLSENGAMFTITSGVTLILDNNITLRGRSSNNDSLVRVNSGGTFTMNGGTVSGNTSSASGGGVYAVGTFTMNGGTISGNTSSASGGGVYAADNSFTMNGGTISGNTSSSTSTSGGGGGVYTTGTFRMNSGEIRNNTARTSGGGVYAATFTMSGGTISGNTSSSYGGGVYATTFTMSDGVISGNTASSTSGSAGYGGGVYATTFTMSGGTISGNTASSTSTSGGFGGGVYAATFTMSGGAISGNTASSTSGGYGGGVYVPSNGTFTMSGTSKISGNTGNYGGGVFVVNNGTFRMNSGEISGNTARTSGGGVHVVNNGTFTKTGGTITSYASNTENGNAVRNSSGALVNNQGHAVYAASYPVKRRETTAGPAVNMDSSTAGSAGGWDN